MTAKRKVGPGGGDFALNPNRFVGGGGGGGKSIITGRESTVQKYKRSGKGKRSRDVPISPTGKTFGEQEFKTTIKVKVKFKDGTTHIDEVKGLNEGHALARARSNWPGAAVIKIK
jgi:hypothetical protein